MMKSCLTVFQEGDGSWSMTRCGLAFSTLVVLGTWAGCSISRVCHGGGLLDIPWGVTIIVGYAWGVKGWQKPHESDGPPCTGDK